jgi:hypothetical protein
MAFLFWIGFLMGRNKGPGRFANPNQAYPIIGGECFHSVELISA